MKKDIFKDMNHENPTDSHKKLLGYHIPENYFEQSKNELLTKIQQTKVNDIKTHYLKKSWMYAIAASVVVILGTVWYFQNNVNRNTITSDQIQWTYSDFDNETILIDALMIPDNQMEQFVNKVFENEIFDEAAIQEEQIDDILINSMMVEDSVYDDYFEEKVLSNIVL